eukprot:3936804-Pleurochrysis_carterae.AAC.2
MDSNQYPSAQRKGQNVLNPSGVTSRAEQYLLYQPRKLNRPNTINPVLCTAASAAPFVQERKAGDELVEAVEARGDE